MPLIRTSNAFHNALQALALSGICAVGVQAAGQAPSVRRLPGNPIISPASDPSMGTNINGPSLIRVPAWVKKPLGKYYLYFADHNGKYLRLAYADRVEGPWKVHRPGTLPLAQSYFTDHVASPEAMVDEERRQIRLYYHGLSTGEGRQHTRVALSKDGLNFQAQEEPVGRGSAYWRLFHHGDWRYALVTSYDLKNKTLLALRLQLQPRPQTCGYPSADLCVG